MLGPLPWVTSGLDEILGSGACSTVFLAFFAFGLGGAATFSGAVLGATAGLADFTACFATGAGACFGACFRAGLFTGFAPAGDFTGLAGAFLATGFTVFLVTDFTDCLAGATFFLATGLAGAAFLAGAFTTGLGFATAFFTAVFATDFFGAALLEEGLATTFFATAFCTDFLAAGFFPAAFLTGFDVIFFAAM
ncbi:MAG: hypothetical protein IT230_14705 [Flavobacteriales bacterium]|nr:hypothetical protein [Flavobacteriales bacterium]